MPDVDVVIIGAGPAGSSAAAALGAEPETRVCLIEKAGGPGRHISPLTFEEVPALYGLGPAVKARYAGFSYVYPGQKAVTFDYKQDAFAVLDYGKACDLLDQKAMAGKGIERIRGEVAGLSQKDDTVLTTLRDGTQIQSRFVIDGSGRGQAALKAMDSPFNGYYSHVLGYYLEVEEDIEQPLAVFLSPHSAFGNGGGWLYTLGRHHLSFGYAAVRKFREYPAQALEKNFQDAKAAYSKIFPFLDRARSLHAESGSIPG